MFKVQSLLVNKGLWSTIQHIHVLFITMSSDTNIYIKQCHETNDHCANDKKHGIHGLHVSFTFTKEECTNNSNPKPTWDNLHAIYTFKTQKYS